MFSGLGLVEYINIQPKSAPDTSFVPSAVKAKDSLLLIKLTFWGAMFLTVPACLSIVAVMFTIFGTHGQDVLVGVHQYTGLGLVLLTIIHVYLVLRRRLK